MMDSLIHRLVPEPAERWRRGGVEFQDFDLADGRTVTAPVFDTPEVGKVDLRELKRDEIRRGGREVGYRALVAVMMENEPPSLAQIRRIDDDKAMNPNLYVGDGTALGTSLHGYADARAEELAQVGISTLQRGEVFSARTCKLDALDPRRALAAVLHSRRMSLMRRVQFEQVAEARLRAEYDLPNRSIQIGDSQPGIKIPGTAFVAEQLHGSEVVAIDPRAVLTHEGIRLRDTMEAGKWIVAQGLGTAALVKDALVHRNEESLRELLHTVDPDVAFMLGMALGSTPALINGEHGLLLDLMRRDMAGTQTIATKDHLLRTGAKEAWAQFLHMNREFVDANHLFVASKRARAPQVQRLGKTVELDAQGVDLRQLTQDQVNWVYGPNANVVAAQTAAA